MKLTIGVYTNGKDGGGGGGRGIFQWTSKEKCLTVHSQISSEFDLGVK